MNIKGVVVIRVLVLLVSASLAGCGEFKQTKPVSNSVDKNSRAVTTVDTIDNSNIKSDHHNRTPSGYTLDHTKPSPPDGRVLIEYKTFQGIVVDVQTNARLTALSDADTNERLAHVPLGGQFTVKIFRKDIESARGSNFKFILLVDGEEVLKRAGGPQNPINFNDEVGYLNVETVDVDVNISQGEIIEFIVEDIGKSVVDRFVLTRVAAGI